MKAPLHATGLGLATQVDAESAKAAEKKYGEYYPTAINAGTPTIAGTLNEKRTAPDSLRDGGWQRPRFWPADIESWLEHLWWDIALIIAGTILGVAAGMFV